MSKKTILILWSVTGTVALILLGITVNLAIQSNAQGGETGQHVRAYLTSEQPLIIILEKPEQRSIVASIQERGVSIVVTEYLRRSGEDWYHVNFSETEAGWVQGEYISLERP